MPPLLQITCRFKQSSFFPLHMACPIICHFVMSKHQLYMRISGKYFFHRGAIWAWLAAICLTSFGKYGLCHTGTDIAAETVAFHGAGNYICWLLGILLVTVRAGGNWQRRNRREAEIERQKETPDAFTVMKEHWSEVMCVFNHCSNTFASFCEDVFTQEYKTKLRNTLMNASVNCWQIRQKNCQKGQKVCVERIWFCFPQFIVSNRQIGKLNSPISGFYSILLSLFDHVTCRTPCAGS